MINYIPSTCIHVITYPCPNCNQLVLDGLQAIKHKFWIQMSFSCRHYVASPEWTLFLQYPSKHTYTIEIYRDMHMYKEKEKEASPE